MSLSHFLKNKKLLLDTTRPFGCFLNIIVQFLKRVDIFTVFFFNTDSHSVAQAVQSLLIATSASWVKVILLPQLPEYLGLQVPATTPD